MCWVFYDIMTQGYFILGESRLLVRCGECVLVGYSIIYVGYLLTSYLHNSR